METNEYVMQCEDPKKVQYGPSIFIMRDSNLEQDISRATSDPGVAHLYETYHVLCTVRNESCAQGKSLFQCTLLSMT